MKLLKKLSACSEGIEFASNYETIEQAWNNCQRGDWMLWLAGKLNVDYKHISIAKGLCAFTVRHLMTDKRSKGAIIAAVRYGKGLITIEELKTAADAAAVYAAYAAEYSSAETSSYADAAYAAYSAAAFVTSGASAGYASTANSAAYAGRTKNMKRTAEICRKYLTSYVLEKLKENE
jgi:hypothetical protein